MRRQKSTDDIIRIDGVGKPPPRYDERSQQPLERDAGALTKALLGSVVSPGEAGSNRRESRLQSLAPAESPFPIRRLLAASRGRCSPGLHPLRGLPDQPLGLRPPLVCLPPDRCRPPSEESDQTLATWPHFRVSIRPTLRGSPQRSSSLPEVFHLVRSPPDLPPTATSKPVSAVSNTPCKQEMFFGFGCHKQ
jgi:hypothetical protein